MKVRNDYIAYCFANSDIIKAGSYTGNGSSDGVFVFTGGRVQWLMIKRTDGSMLAGQFGTSVNEYNVVASILYSMTVLTMQTQHFSFRQHRFCFKWI
jgi:hypothetical protein